MVKSLINIFAKSAGTKLPIRQKKGYQRNYPAKKGIRKDLGIEFKSSMEANIYRYYQYLMNTRGKINKVEYEPEIFYFKPNKFGIRAYVPDFKIHTDTGYFFIESKGKMDDPSRKKAWLLSKNYPWIKLYLITPRSYNLIRKYYARFIPFWEK